MCDEITIKFTVLLFSVYARSFVYVFLYLLLLFLCCISAVSLIQNSRIGIAYLLYSLDDLYVYIFSSVKYMLYVSFAVW